MMCRNMHSPKIGRMISFVLAFILMVSLFSVNVMAENSDETSGETSTETSTETSGETSEDSTDSSEGSKLPVPSDSFYVYDKANVLTPETESAIVARNKDLFAKYGVQIVVMTENQLTGETYDERVQYANQIMESWKIGGDANRGMLLALSISDKDYIVVAGKDLQSEFSSEVLKKMLDEKLEPDFKEESYDAGVKAFFTAAADQVEAKISKLSPTKNDKQEDEKNTASDQKEGNGFLSVLKGIGITLLVILILLILLIVVSYIHGQMVRKRRREARRRRREAANLPKTVDESELRTTHGKVDKEQIERDYREFMNRY